MAIIEQYLELRELESKYITSVWKYCQIIVYLVTGVSGIITAYMFGRAYDSFNTNCMLYSNVTFKYETNRWVVDDLKTEWNKPSDCLFCQYVPVCSVIYSIVWGTFFAMCGKGGKTRRGMSQPWRIVCPATLLNLLFSIVTVVSAIKLRVGLRVFCRTFMINNNRLSCMEIKDQYYVNDVVPARGAMEDLTVAEAVAWINTIAWFVSVVLLLLRCCCVVDFSVVRVSVLSNVDPLLEMPIVEEITEGEAGSRLQVHSESAVPTTVLPTKGSPRLEVP